MGRSRGRRARARARASFGGRERSCDFDYRGAWTAQRVGWVGSAANRPDRRSAWAAANPPDLSVVASAFHRGEAALQVDQLFSELGQLAHHGIRLPPLQVLHMRIARDE